MTNRLASLRAFGWFAALVLALTACEPLIAPYDPQAYSTATSLKARSLALIDKSVEPYAAHEAEAEELMTRLDEAYEYAAGLPSNSESARQWDLMRDRDGNLMGLFVATWQNAGEEALSPVFAGEIRREISGAFDEIICLEASKREPVDCENPEGDAS